jgi:hypothetical protein
MTANPFLNIADRQMAAPVKARQRAVDQRAQTRIDKDEIDRERLMKAWCQWQQRQLDDVLVGPYGAQIAALLAFLKELSLDREAELVEFIRTDTWRSANADVRFLVMRLIGSTLAKLREEAGLAPFDDPLLGEPRNVFLQIRELLR